MRPAPKAHLHLHFTGSMRHATLVELARTARSALPPALKEWPPKLSAADERGWFRFQRLYDIARSVLRTRRTCRLVRETAEDERAEGSRWLEIQVDPSGYAAVRRPHRVHRAGARRRREGGHRRRDRRHRRGQPDQAPAGRPDPGPAGRPVRRAGVTGFGLSNDERRGPAGGVRAGLPHRRAGRAAARRTAASWCGPASVAACLDDCTRTGSGTASGGRGPEALSSGWPPRASPARSARPPTSRWASPPDPRRTSRCGPCSSRGPGRARRRRPAAVRPSAGRAVRDRPRRARVHPTPSWPTWPAMSIRGSAAPPGPRPTASRHRRLAVGGVDAGDDLAGQGEQVGGRGVTRVDQGQGVLGGDAGRGGGTVALAKPACSISHAAGTLTRPSPAG
jgi:hypothetical protein